MRETIGITVHRIEAPAATAPRRRPRGARSTGVRAAWDAGRALPPEEAVAGAERLARAMADGSSPVPSTPQHARQAAPTSAHPGERLTLREVEAPRQIAAGQTDQAIGDRLVISRRTVTTYVTSILGKLGLSARSAAAAYAVRHGLA